MKTVKDNSRIIAILLVSFVVCLFFSILQRNYACAQDDRTERRVANQKGNWNKQTSHSLGSLHNRKGETIMKNRTGFTGKVLLIISFAFTVCIVILSVWYFLFQEQKTLNQQEIPSKTPIWSNTETTIIEESVIPLSDEAVMDAQQTDDESVTSTQQTGDESGEESSSTSEHNEISEIMRSEDEIFMELFSEEWDQLEMTLKNAIAESAVLREILIDIDEREDEASADYAVRVAQSGISIEEYERGVDRIATSFQEERREILERAFEIETLLYDSEILDLFGHWPREDGRELHEYLTTR